MLSEVVPFAIPQFDALLAGIGVVIGALVALGLIVIIRRFTTGLVSALAYVFSFVPLLGGLVDQALDTIEHWLDTELSAAERELDGVVASWFHFLAVEANWLATEVAQNASALLALAKNVIGPEGLRLLGSLVDYVLGQVAAWVPTIMGLLEWTRRMDHELAGLVGGALDTAIHAVVDPIVGSLQGVDRWLGGRVTGLEQALEGAIPADIAALRDWAGRIQAEYDGLARRLNELAGSVAGVGTTALVATALTTLGADWITCRNWGRLGRGGCGLPGNLLESLLADAVDVLIVADICQLSELITYAAVAFEPVLEELVNLEGFICSAGGAHFPSAILDVDLGGGAGFASGIVAADLAA